MATPARVSWLRSRRRVIAHRSRAATEKADENVSAVVFSLIMSCPLSCHRMSFGSESIRFHVLPVYRRMAEHEMFSRRGELEESVSPTSITPGRFCNEEYGQEIQGKV